MNYINPLELLEISSTDSKEIKKAKRRKLAEIELSDDGYIEFQNKEIRKSDFLGIVDELDNSNKASFYSYLKSDKAMSNFLSFGNLDVFEDDFNSEFYQQDEFKTFITPYFTQKFSDAFKNAYQNKDSYQIKLLERASELADKQQLELLYKPTYKQLKNTVKQLQEIEKNIEDEYDEDDANEVFHDVKDIVEIKLINALPYYFQSIRNSIGKEIRNISVNVFNELNSSEEALNIIRYAQKLKTDSLTKSKLKDDFVKIQEIHEERLENARHQPILQKYALKLLLIKQIIDDLENNSTSVTDLRARLNNFVELTEINNLPEMFSEIRNQIALGIRGVSVAVWNNLSDLNYSLELLNLASRIPTDLSTRLQIGEAQKQLNDIKNQKAENERQELKQIIDLLSGINSQVRVHGSYGINHEKIYELLNEIFSIQNIKVFSTFQDKRHINLMVDEVIKLCKDLRNNYARNVLARLKNIAGNDYQLKTKIENAYNQTNPIPRSRTTSQPSSYSSTQQVTQSSDNETSIGTVITWIGIIGFIIFLISQCGT